MGSEWNFGPDVVAAAKEIRVGDRVAVHWSEAECQDQEGTVVGVDIGRYGKVGYAVHIDGDISPTDGFTHDRAGQDGGTIRLLVSTMTPTSEVVARLTTDAEYLARKRGLYPTIGKDCAEAAALISSLVARDDARRDAMINQGLFEVECEKHREWLDNYIAMESRALTAERLLAEARAMHSWPTEAQFQYGDWVEKFTGEALWEGRVVSAYHTKRLALRYVVEVEPQGFQMIAVPAQLRASIGGGNG